MMTVSALLSAILFMHVFVHMALLLRIDLAAYNKFRHYKKLSQILIHVTFYRNFYLPMGTRIFVAFVVLFLLITISGNFSEKSLAIISLLKSQKYPQNPFSDD